MHQTFIHRTLLSGAALATGSQSTPPRTILWITCEDLSPILGCYGDGYAQTPNLDKLASEGVRYTCPFPTASRSRSFTILPDTGMGTTSLGTMHLPGMQPLPPGVTCFTEYLRNPGYSISNNEKQDWDESSNTAHCRPRKPGQPYFSVFNLMTTHHGQIWYSVSARIAAAEATLIMRNFAKARAILEAKSCTRVPSSRCKPQSHFGTSAKKRGSRSKSHAAPCLSTADPSRSAPTPKTHSKRPFNG